MKPFALLENQKSNFENKDNYFFSEFIDEIICYEQENLEASFANIESWRQQGKYLVGFVSYEVGYYLQGKSIVTFFKKSEIIIPLLHFAVFNRCEILSSDSSEFLLKTQDTSHQDDSIVYNLQLPFSESEYIKKYKHIKNYILKGESYQVNFTGKYHFNYQGEPIKLYLSLRQRQTVSYSGFLNFNHYSILSLSPELFFKKTNNTILVQPMKGTYSRSLDPVTDEKNKLFLKKDEKNRAENMMIVDLLRNDLGKISEPGSINVVDLFKVESYETLHQMISTIKATIKKELTFYDILKALFPSGSVTGAPKLRTMEIIHELENKSRGLYTGALGYILPNNDMCFNVPIRTIVLQNNIGELGVGSGVLWDSQPNEEYAEIQLKAKFLTDLDPGFELVECFFYSKETSYRNLSLHLKRIQQSAKIFNFNCNVEKMMTALTAYKKYLAASKQYKIKLTLNKKGDIRISHELILCMQDKSPLFVLIAKEFVDSQNILLQHKTTASSVRGFYDEMFKKYCKERYFDVIFCNEKGEITEGTRSNIFAEISGKIYTPPNSAGLLPGIQRQEFMKNHMVIECSLKPSDLQQANKLWLSNSVRGVKTVSLLFHA